MEDILFKIIETKRLEIASTDYGDIETRAKEITRPCLSMSQSLRKTKGGIIAEFKRHSPSKKWINKDANVQEIVTGYRNAGAAACSILTDEQFFKGSLEYLRMAREIVEDIPLLRKEFIIDARQVYEARVAGADAILLIAACLSIEECRKLTSLAHSVGLEVLLELHSENELVYLDSDTDMVGVNNRNLGSFVTDIQNSYKLIDKIKDKSFDIPIVSESGIDSASTINNLRKVGFTGFLIGEQFMRTESAPRALTQLISELC